MNPHAYMARRDFWCKLAADLSITDRSLVDLAPPRELSEQDQSALGANMRRMGYFQLSSHVDPGTCVKLATAIDTLVAQGLPPVFIMMYDEAWSVLAGLQAIIREMIGDEFSIAADFWAWQVTAASPERGWRPHRDSKLSVAEVVREDGRLNMMTLWVALTDATLENACMYLLPLDADESYPQDIQADVVSLGSLHHARALPLLAGGVLGWNPLVLHWGAPRFEADSPPRVNLSLYIQRADYRGFGVTGVDLAQSLPFVDRLALVTRAVTIYHERSGIPFDSQFLAFCESTRHFYDLAHTIR